MKVLIVEQNLMVLKSLRKIFEDRKFCVDACYDSQSALNLLQNRSDIKIILCDYDIDGTNGIEFFNTVKSKLLWDGHFILVSGRKLDSLSDDEVCNTNSFTYFRKPYVIDDIFKSIRRWDPIKYRDVIISEI